MSEPMPETVTVAAPGANQERELREVASRMGCEILSPCVRVSRPSRWR